jgi:hypothetical protein
MESGARPSAPDKIHFTSQSHQLYRPSGCLQRCERKRDRHSMICILHSKGNETQNFSTPTADANEASVRPPRLIGSLLAGRTTPRTGLAVVAARSHQPSHPCSLFRSTSFHSTRISTPGPRETLRERDRGSCVPRSSPRQVGVGLVEGRRWRSIPLGSCHLLHV